MRTKSLLLCPSCALGYRRRGLDGQHRERFDLGATIYSKSGISAEIGVGFEGLGGDGYSSKSINGRLKIPLN